MAARLFVRGAVAALAALALTGPATAQLQDAFAPAPKAVPTSGAELHLGKCINLSNMFDAPSEGRWGRWPVDEDIGRIADAGFTAIRLPVRFSAHADQHAPYTIDPAFMDRVAHVVELANRHGLAVIVDMHHYIELFSDPEGNSTRLAGMWRQVAERFKDAPSSVSFELINEPHDKLTAANLMAVVGPALAAVRASNPVRTVVWDGPEWSGLDAMATGPFPADDPNVIPTFHYYSPVNFGLDHADWLTPKSKDSFGSAADLAEIRADLAKAQAYVARTGRVPFVGEYGAWEGRPLAAREQYYETVSEAFASIGLESCDWGYANTFQLWDDKTGWRGHIAERIAAPLPPAPPAGSPVALHGALSVRGNQVVDAHGAPVTLRGMSLFWSQAMPQYYSAETVDWLVKDWKITAIRAAIAAEGNNGARQHFDGELAKAERVIDAAVKNGIYVVVDWHAHHAFPNEAQEFLTAIARRYGHLPNLIYEDWNEPLRDGVEWSANVKPYHLQVIGAIRAIDPDNLVIAGSPSWSQDVDLAAQDPLPFTNVAYTLHYYAGSHKQDLRDKADAARAKGLALFVTEFGTVNADGDGPIDLAEAEKWWAWDEANHVSWLDWAIDDKRESSATLKPGAAISGWTDADLTDSGKLLRSRLRAAAGVTN